MSQDNGGPAFPVPGLGELPTGGFDWGHDGMTLRDYFAAKALEGDWASQSNESGEWATDIEQQHLERRATVYYRMADAMLKVRRS